jgi:hypothetical protein
MPRVPNCPITLEPLVDPVIDPEGNTFERAAIFAWIREHGTRFVLCFLFFVF